MAFSKGNVNDQILNVKLKAVSRTKESFSEINYLIDLLLNIKSKD